MTEIGHMRRCRGKVNSLQLTRHAEERGRILQLLADTEMSSVSSLQPGLELSGYVISSESLFSHCRYLQQSGYIRVLCSRDLPGWRSDRRSEGNPDEPRFVALLPKGLQLISGQIEADPMVRFI